MHDRGRDGREDRIFMTDGSAAVRPAPSTTGGAPADTRRNYLIGVAMALVGSAFLSIAGVIMRHVEQATEWQMLFWRSVIFAGAIFLWLLYRYKARLLQAFMAIGRLGILIALVMGTSFIGYVLALAWTPVASAMVVLSSGPMFAALFGLAILKEKVRPRTWFAIALATAGLIATVTEGLGVGTLAGILAAFVAIATFQLMIVLLRDGRERDMLPAACLAGLFAAAVAATQMDSFILTSRDFALASALGLVQNAGGFALIAMAAKRVPAAQMGLIGLVEPILATIWVWLLVNEAPGLLTLGGGALVLLAVVFNTVGGIRRRSN
jgi:drug/metabolite transporter (DMT)-like permease